MYRFTRLTPDPDHPVNPVQNQYPVNCCGKRRTSLLTGICGRRRAYHLDTQRAVLLHVDVVPDGRPGDLLARIVASFLAAPFGSTGCRRSPPWRRFLASGSPRFFPPGATGGLPTSVVESSVKQTLVDEPPVPPDRGHLAWVGSLVNLQQPVGTCKVRRVGNGVVRVAHNPLFPGAGMWFSMVGWAVKLRQPTHRTGRLGAGGFLGVGFLVGWRPVLDWGRLRLGPRWGRRRFLLRW